MAYDLLRRRMVSGNYSCNIGSTLDDMEALAEAERTRAQQAKEEADEKAKKTVSSTGAASLGRHIRRSISGADRDRQVEKHEDGSKFC